MPWDKIAVILWIVILSALFAYELFALLDHNMRTPPLTWVTVRYAPWWATMPFLTWLWLHFATRYANPEYIRRLLGK